MRAYARHTDPQTSHDAAEVATKTLRVAHHEVLFLFKCYRRMIDEKLIKKARLHGYKQADGGLRTRRSELVKMGKLRNSGLKGRTSLNSPSIIWEIVE